MLLDIPNGRVGCMSDQEERWLHNAKKAFFASDQAYVAGNAADRSMEEFCKAVDTCKTLRRSLRSESTDHAQNKRRFVDFINSEIPSADQGGMLIELTDARTGAHVSYSFGELVYAIRCMIHENENLDIRDGVEYHIALDWSRPHDEAYGELGGGRVVLNAHRIWNRLREILSKFIMGIDAMKNASQGKGWSIHIRPDYCSIRP